MTNAQKAAIMTWLQSAVALAALFIPGLNPGMQLAIIGFGGATLTAYIALTYKDSPARKDDNPLVQYDEARVKLERETRIEAPTVEAIIQGPGLVPPERPQGGRDA